jgi:hypothetical protein
VLALAIVASLLIAAVGFAAAGARALNRADRREIGGRGRFLSAFDGSAIPAELLVQAYETLSRRVAPAARDIRPADRMVEQLGLTDVDVEDVALLIAARCEARIPTAHDLDELGARVRTVDDLVRFLAPFCTRAPMRLVAG